MQNNDIQFDSLNIRQNTNLNVSESPAIIRKLIKIGLVKDEKQAFILVIVGILFCLLLSGIIIYMNFFKKPIVPPMTAEEEMIYNQIQLRRNNTSNQTQ